MLKKGRRGSKLKKLTALIITDLQNDFMPSGALPIKEGEAIIPIVLQIAPLFSHIYTTQDWHPNNHVSFAINHGKRPGEIIEIHGKSQILWPVHCVQETLGADLIPRLQRIAIEKKIYKGENPLIDSYSAFFDNEKKKSTGLNEYLKKRGIQKLFFSGFATDFCILYSIKDAIDQGFIAYVIRDACRAMNKELLDETKALVAMENYGAVIILSREISSYL